MSKIQKIDDEKRLVFGWANVSIRADGEQIVDRQKDIIDPEDLEDAAYAFVELYGDGGEMHENPKVAKVVESCIFTPEKCEAIGITQDKLPTGWWIGFHVLDDDVWEKVKSGEYSMFSIAGTGQRVEVDDGN